MGTEIRAEIEAKVRAEVEEQMMVELQQNLDMEVEREMQQEVEQEMQQQSATFYKDGEMSATFYKDGEMSIRLPANVAEESQSQHISQPLPSQAEEEARGGDVAAVIETVPESKVEEEEEDVEAEQQEQVGAVEDAGGQGVGCAKVEVDAADGLLPPLADSSTATTPN